MNRYCTLLYLTLAKSDFCLGSVHPGLSISIMPFRSSLACVLAAFVEVWLVLVILMCPVVELLSLLLLLLLELELALSVAFCSVLSTCLTTRLFVKSSMGSSVPSSGSASASNLLLLFSCDLVVTIWSLVSPVSGIGLSACIWVDSGYLSVSLVRSACPEQFFNLELLEMRLNICMY